MAFTVTSLGGTSVKAAQHSLVLSSVTIGVGDLLVVTGALQPNASGDAIVVSDSAGNSWTVVQVLSGGATVSIEFIAYAVIATALSSGSVTVADTSNGSTNFSVCAFHAFDVAGAATSSPEDTAAQATHGAAATTSPTITSGTPAQAGDLFFAVYGSPATNTSTYTEDTGNGWTNASLKEGTSGATPNITTSAAYLTNSGTGTKTHTPTTSSSSYGQVLIAFKAAPPAAAVRSCGTIFG
jgi:hypothetical protein